MRPERIASLLRSSLELDFHINTGSKIELHQRIDRLRRRIDNIEKPPVRAHLELLAALLVDMRRSVHRKPLDTGWKRDRTTDLGAGSLCRVHDLTRRRIEDSMIEGFEPYANVLTLHFQSSVIRSQASGNPEPRALISVPYSYSTIFATTPAPTVRPPSRMANLSFSSIAIGVINSTSIVTLSPGITISVDRKSVV